jgi:hypothetical protein
MPKWFLFPPAVYAPRAQKMDQHQLYHVMDAILNKIRGYLSSIQTMHGMLDRVYKNGTCSIGMRAGIDAFFTFLEDESLAKMGGNGRVVKQEAPEEAEFSSSANVASKLTSVGRENAEEGEAMSQNWNRHGNILRSPMHASPANSTANRSQVTTIPEEKIDFEEYMSEQWKDEKAGEEELRMAGRCWCKLNMKQTFSAMPNIALSRILARGTWFVLVAHGHLVFGANQSVCAGTYHMTPSVAIGHAFHILFCCPHLKA